MKKESNKNFFMRFKLLKRMTFQGSLSLRSLADTPFQFISQRSFFVTGMAAALAAVLICSVPSTAMAVEISSDEIDRTRATLEKWVETRQIISLEKRDWVLGREMLNERIDLVQREIDSLRAKIDEANKNITDADKKRAGLVDENDTLKEGAAALKLVEIRLEKRTRDLLQKLPDSIRDRVKPLSQRFPADPNESKMSLSERFQNVVGVLNEVNKFNREITTTSEVRVLPDGSSSEVTALYVGIGQAYYANNQGNIAGVGTISDDRWTWIPANEAAVRISEAIAILNNEKMASFIQLPIKIQ
ncbi:MAG: DUF3450 domain-containing protein [Candidatus Omnitrophica bacterium]|nr:DUF3450 domain-containing protein [Candidatus Omnitrophota bacterium]